MSKNKMIRTFIPSFYNPHIKKLSVAEAGLTRYVHTIWMESNVGGYGYNQVRRSHRISDPPLSTIVADSAGSTVSDKFPKKMCDAIWLKKKVAKAIGIEEGDEKIPSELYKVALKEGLHIRTKIVELKKEIKELKAALECEKLAKQSDDQ